MHMKKLITAVGLVALLTLTGAGCSTAKKSGSDSDSGPSVTVTDPADNSETLETYITKTFGKATITSFLNDFPIKGSTGIEYKISRPAQQKDVAVLENLLKKNGYEAESELADGEYAVGGYKKNNAVVFTFEIGKAKVGALLMPISKEEWDELESEE